MIIVEKKENKHLKYIANTLTTPEGLKIAEEEWMPKILENNTFKGGIKFYFNVETEEWVPEYIPGFTFLKTTIKKDKYTIDNFVNAIQDSIQEYFKLTSEVNDSKLLNSFNSGILSYIDIENYQSLFRPYNVSLYTGFLRQEAIQYSLPYYDSIFKEIKLTGKKLKSTRIFNTILQDENFAKGFSEFYDLDSIIDHFDINQLKNVQTGSRGINEKGNVHNLYLKSIIRILEVKDDQLLKDKFIEKFLDINLNKYYDIYRLLFNLIDNSKYCVLTNCHEALINKDIIYKLDYNGTNYPQFMNSYINVMVSRDAKAIFENYVNAFNDLVNSGLKKQVNHLNNINVNIVGFYDPIGFNGNIVKIVNI